jgi:hypothetical protein
MPSFPFGPLQVMDPVRSRCLCVRVPAPADDQVREVRPTGLLGHSVHALSQSCAAPSPVIPGACVRPWGATGAAHSCDDPPLLSAHLSARMRFSCRRPIQLLGVVARKEGLVLPDLFAAKLVQYSGRNLRRCGFFAFIRNATPLRFDHHSRVAASCSAARAPQRCCALSTTSIPFPPLFSPTRRASLPPLLPALGRCCAWRCARCSSTPSPTARSRSERTGSCTSQVWRADFLSSFGFFMSWLRCEALGLCCPWPCRAAYEEVASLAAQPVAVCPCVLRLLPCRGRARHHDRAEPPAAVRGGVGVGGLPVASTQGVLAARAGRQNGARARGRP